jgi:disulfide bond formation protein DsbB
MPSPKDVRMIAAARQLVHTAPVSAAALAVALIGGVALIGAWGFQYVGGLAPCPLCLEQRVAYYFAVPLACLVLLGESVGASRKVLIAALAVIAAMMLWNAGLGLYHAGVEWRFWEGPRDCTGNLQTLGGAGGLLQRMQSAHVVRCDEAAWRFLGISLAGYNALISFALAAIAAAGAYRSFRETPR